MLLEKKKIVFIHVPKTGGNSFSHLLKKYSDEKFIRHVPYSDKLNFFEIQGKYTDFKHQPLSFYKEKLGKNFKEFKIVTIVRNPLDRFLSIYYMPDYNMKTNFFVKKINRFTKKYLDNYLFSSRFYAYEAPKLNLDLMKFYINNLQSQKSYLSFGNKYFNPDYLIKYEDYNQGIKKFCKSLKIDYKLVHVNKSKREKLSRIKLKKIEKLILSSHHKEDYKTFKYSPLQN